jgi:rSAM/selenodomain-associated transferase 1
VTRGALVVFARQPAPGRVKTRLTPPFSPEQAAALYRAMLADVLDASAAMAERFGLDAVLAVTPPEACAELARSAPAAFRAVAQRGPDLGARMEWAAAEAAAAGAAPIVLRGSDSPALAADAVGDALRALDGHDLALIPDRDGGYGLVALRRPAPGLFSHPMSTASVLADTLAQASRLGLRARVLGPGFDVDTAADLRWLAAARSESGSLCPRTLAYLDAERLWPVP